MILPITLEGKVVLVSKFCAPKESWILTLPGGKIEKGLNPMETAIKELTEETGYVPNNLISLTNLEILPSYLKANTYCYLAKDVVIDKNSIIDRSEHLKIKVYKFERVLQLIKDGVINDSRTVAAILYYTTFFQD